MRRQIAGLYSNKQCKFLHILESLVGSKHSKDLGQIKSTVSDVLYASLAMPEETSSCFQIYISNLSDLSEQLHKQIFFYCTAREYAGTKQQLSISVGFGVQEEFWEHEQGTFPKLHEERKISCAFSRLWVNTISRTLTLLTDSLQQEEAIICVNLTISWYAIGLARLGVASISCGLLHSCGVLRLSIRSHILG